MLLEFKRYSSRSATIACAQSARGLWRLLLAMIVSSPSAHTMGRKTLTRRISRRSQADHRGV